MSERLPTRFAIDFEQTSTGWRASIPGYLVEGTGPFGYQEAHAAVLAEVARRHAAGQPSTTPDATLADAVEGVSIEQVLRRVADATKEPRVVVVDQPKAAELVHLLNVAAGKGGGR